MSDPLRLDGSDPQAIDVAARRWAAGGLVGWPTETVYGLGARADDDEAVRAIYAAKGRPAGHPLIVHVAESAGVHAFAAEWPAAAARLVAAFWPGPLTLIVPRRAGVADVAAGGHPTIGLRCPSHPVARALLRAAAARGVPGVAAPSANRFGRISPTRAEHVRAEFGPELMVVDGGPCQAGIESAIVDLSGPAPRLLRPGTLDRLRLAAALGQALTAPRDGLGATHAPGTLAAHYAPRARVTLHETGAAWAAAAGDASTSTRRALLGRTDPGAPHGPGVVVWRAMPAEPLAAAADLFAALRELDALGVDEIRVEAPPAEPAWEGVADRLRRAAAAGAGSGAGSGA